MKEIKHQQWSNVPGVHTGTRLVCMVRKHDIPRNVIIDGVNCRVWYKGQPLVCDICNDNHKAADCPLKGKCKWCHEAGHFVRHCPKPAWYVPGDPATHNDEDFSDNDSVANDVGAGADNVPVVVPDAVELVVVPEAVPAGDPAGPVACPPPVASSSTTESVPGAALEVEASESAVVSEAMVVDERDNKLDELVSQPLLVSQSKGAEKRVLDPSPTQGLSGDGVLEVPAMVAPQEEVLDSSPSFSPLSESVLSLPPSLGGSVGVAGDSSASLGGEKDSRVLRSRISVKAGRAGGSMDLPPLVSPEEKARMVQRLKAALLSSTDDLVEGTQPSHSFAVPLPPRVRSRSGLGMALHASSCSRSRSGDERPPLSQDSHRSSR